MKKNYITYEQLKKVVEDFKKITQSNLYFSNTGVASIKKEGARSVLVSDLIENIDYAALVKLQEASRLIPGKMYCIKDYSAKIKPVITADSVKSFSHIAFVKTLFKTIEWQFTQYVDGMEDSYGEFPAHGKDYHSEDTIVSYGKEINPETDEETLVLYKTNASIYGDEPDEGDPLFYVGTYEFEGVLYDRWEKYERENESFASQYILTNIIVKDGEVDLSDVSSSYEIKYDINPDLKKYGWASEGSFGFISRPSADNQIRLRYTLYLDGEDVAYEDPNPDGSEYPNDLLHSDIFVDADERDGKLYIYKTAVGEGYEPDDVDYADEFEYVDDFELDGTVYNRWLKTESDESGSGERVEYCYVLTDIIVGIAGDKGIIYYMKDGNGNEAPFDFKNIKINDQFAFGGDEDKSDSTFFNNKIGAYVVDGKLQLPNVIIESDGCSNLKIEDGCHDLHITDDGDDTISNVDIKSGIAGTEETPLEIEIVTSYNHTEIKPTNSREVII